MAARIARVFSGSRPIWLAVGAALAFLCAAAGASWPAPAVAEYRAYRIAIRNSVTGAERMVVATLDPLQYPGYIPLRPNESASLAASWMCRSRSDWFTPTCPEPPRINKMPVNAPLSASESASESAPSGAPGAAPGKRPDK
jgi:hypothetical protein